MRSPAARIAIGIATVAAVVVLFIVFTGGDDSNDNRGTTTTTQAAQGTTTTTTQTQTVEATQQITVRGGKPAGGVKRLEYNKGERVRFIVTSDTADEVHVHGYDMTKEVPAGGSVRFGFPASIEGVFEVELHHSEQQIAELRVSP